MATTQVLAKIVQQEDGRWLVALERDDGKVAWSAERFETAVAAREALNAWCDANGATQNRLN